MTRLSWIAIAVLAGCYRPTVRPCQFACDGDACPSGLTCSAGMCVSKMGDTCPGVDAHVIDLDAALEGGLFDAAHDGQIVDGMVTIDASLIDAAMIDAAMIDAAMIDAAVLDASVVDAATVDAPIGIDAPASDAPMCSFHASNVDPCSVGADPVGADWTVNNASITTNAAGSISITGGVPVGTITAMRTLPNGVDVAVILVHSFTLTPGGVLAINGPRPLIILAYGAISIGGTITVQPVDASMLATCATGIGHVGADATGGGGGGSYGDAEGNSGGAGQSTGTPLGGAPGMKDTVVTLEPLRPGCPGGHGGTPSAAGKGGNGGGAFQLSSGGTVTVSGLIQAAGQGGRAGPNNGGGGGGGTGGAILLEGTQLTLNGASLCANGGGGGQSGTGVAADDGQCGTTAALGGGAGAGRGGDGAFGSNVATKGSDGGGGVGGGGGGGGVGRIRVNGPHSGPVLTVSPPISFNP